LLRAQAEGRQKLERTQEVMLGIKLGRYTCQNNLLGECRIACGVTMPAKICKATALSKHTARRPGGHELNPLMGYWKMAVH